MADTTHHTQTGFSLSGAIAAVGSSIYSALIRMGEAQSRIQHLKHLQSLSDEELEKLGLKRDRIVHRVFADSIWL